MKIDSRGSIDRDYEHRFWYHTVDHLKDRIRKQKDSRANIIGSRILCFMPSLRKKDLGTSSSSHLSTPPPSCLRFRHFLILGKTAAVRCTVPLGWVPKIPGGACLPLGGSSNPEKQCCLQCASCFLKPHLPRSGSPEAWGRGGSRSVFLNPGCLFTFEVAILSSLKHLDIYRYP